VPLGYVIYKGRWNSPVEEDHPQNHTLPLVHLHTTNPKTLLARNLGVDRAFRCSSGRDEGQNRHAHRSENFKQLVLDVFVLGQSALLRANLLFVDEEGRRA